MQKKSKKFSIAYCDHFVTSEQGVNLCEDCTNKIHATHFCKSHNVVPLEPKVHANFNGSKDSTFIIFQYITSWRTGSATFGLLTISLKSLSQSFLSSFPECQKIVDGERFPVH